MFLSSDDDDDEKQRWGYDSEQSESDRQLTQAQIDAYERIQNAVWPTEWARMDDDGNCYDSEGHLVEFEYPNSYYGLTSEEEEDEGAMRAMKRRLRTMKRSVVFRKKEKDLRMHIVIDLIIGFVAHIFVIIKSRLRVLCIISSLSVLTYVFMTLIIRLHIIVQNIAISSGLY